MFHLAFLRYCIDLRKKWGSIVRQRKGRCRWQAEKINRARKLGLGEELEKEKERTREIPRVRSQADINQSGMRSREPKVYRKKEK